MKIDELVNHLKNLYTEHGNLDVKLILPDDLIASIEGAIYSTTKKLSTHVIREEAAILRWRGDKTK